MVSGIKTLSHGSYCNGPDKAYRSAQESFPLEMTAIQLQQRRRASDPLDKTCTWSKWNDRIGPHPRRLLFMLEFSVQKCGRYVQKLHDPRILCQILQSFAQEHMPGTSEERMQRIQSQVRIIKNHPNGSIRERSFCLAHHENSQRAVLLNLHF